MLPKIHFLRAGWALGCAHTYFCNFVDISWFLKILNVVWQLLKQLNIVYYFRYHKSHVTCRESNQCWKSKLPKCYCQGCLKTFQTHFESLLMIRMFEHRVLLCLKAEKSIKKPLPIKVKAFSFSAKPNTGDNPYRKLLNLKLFCNLFM